jgi:hypothetical protein
MGCFGRECCGKWEFEFGDDEIRVSGEGEKVTEAC